MPEKIYPPRCSRGARTRSNQRKRTMKGKRRYKKKTPMAESHAMLRKGA
jgi:hypothetical protein